MEYINEIIKLYYQINNIYINLSKLEYEGKKNSVTFMELVSVLKSLIEQENELFDNFYHEFENAQDYEVVDNGDPFVKRLIDFMNFYSVLNVKTNDFDSEEEKIDKTYDVLYGKLYKSCSRNIFLVYLSFLQEYIDSDCFSSYKDKMISYKYYNSFVNHDVEGCLIDFNFEIEKNNYVNLYFVAETLGIDINMCDNIILDCFKDTIEVTIQQILSIKDNEYMDTDNYAMCINNQAMLRAGLSLISKDDYEKNREWLFDMINGLSNQDNQISISIINSIIDGMTKDKQRVMKISMRILKG